jgi:hypothetical protein
LFHGLPFVGGSAAVISQEIKRGETGAAIKPADKRTGFGHFGGHRRGPARQIAENALGDVTREVRGPDLPECRGINKARVAVDDFAKGRFVAAIAVGAEELDVGLFLHLTY